MKDNPLVYLFSKTWKYSEGNRKNVVLYWAMFIIANAFNLIVHPFVLAKIMDVLQKEGISSGNILTLYGLLCLTIVNDTVFWLFHGPARVIERTNAFKVRVNYKKMLLGGVMSLPLPWHIEHHTGDTTDKVEKGTASLYSFSAHSFVVIASFVQLIVSFVMLSYFSRSAMLIVGIMMLVAIWVITCFDKILIPQWIKLNHSENQISKSVVDSISNIGTIIILRVERLIFETISRNIDEPFDLYTSNNKINEWKWAMTNFCCTIMTVLVLGVYLYQKIGTPASVAVASTFLLMQYLDKISGLFFRFAEMYSDIVQYKTKVMNSEEVSDDFVSGSLTNHVLPSNWKKLEIKNLNFSYYKDGEDQHLKDVSLSISRGEKIVFVGETGSGKTTMLKMIRDLYQPSSLELYVDDRIISEGFGGIARAISLVPQKPEIFATTIRENITIGADYCPETVGHFMEIAHFTDVANGLPNGLDSSVKEDGLDLSGGQQQRLALTRGLLACRDKEIILLDEPTSSLDAKTEIEVYQGMLKEFSDKTIIATTHALHLLPLFDRICVFDNGQIVGSGSLSELLISGYCPAFSVLWEAKQKTLNVCVN